MGSNRRKFISKAFMGGLGAAAFPYSSSATDGYSANRNFSDPISAAMKARYAKLDMIRKQPVFKKKLFKEPVIIKDAFGIQCTPHMTGGDLGFLYMMHFVSALPNAIRFHEFKGFTTDVVYECKTSTLKSVNGEVKVPTGPGLGVDIDPDFIKKHEVVKA